MESAPTDPSDVLAGNGERGERPARRTPSSKLFTASVVLITLAITGVLTIVSVNVTRDQEKTLLKERIGELAAVVSTYISDARSTLIGAGSAGAAGGSTEVFDALAASSVITGSNVAVVRRQGGALAIIAAAGAGMPKVGSTPPTEIASVIQRAFSARDAVSGIVTENGARHLVLALKVPGYTKTVAYVDRQLTPAVAAPTDPNSPYRELNVAIYASAAGKPGTLVLLSGDKPEQGSGTVRQTFAAGSDTWSLEISARKPLAGTLATAFPLLVGGAGAILAVVLGLLIEVLVRRRAYALRLVKERTKLLREAQLTAEKANRAKSEFLSRMSHELRTPLNAVLGFAQLLELDDLTPRQAENLSEISNAGSHLLDLINEILDISQIETGHMSLSPEPVLVREVIEEAMQMVRPLAYEKGVHLITGNQVEDHIFADRQRVKQILLNLLANGIKYNRMEGSVSVNCVESSPGRMRIQVTDTGAGIAPEQYPLVFEPFERLGAEQTAVEGSGVGLALSRGLAEAMGGVLDMESAVGRGSTFWLEFPIVESPIETYERSTAQPSQVQQTEDEDRRLTVLHIEDNPANLALVERVLSHRPEITVVPAMQGRLGVELALKYRPILILLDLNLYDIPGDEVLRLLRADPVTADIPVIIISADAMPRQVQRLLSSGALAYLTKPININELLQYVDATLDAVQQDSVPPSRDH